MMKDDIKEVLVSREQIETICKTLGEKITEDYKDKKLLVVGLLRGCMPFMAELILNINLYTELDYMVASSYEGGTSSTGHLVIKSDITTDVKGKDVLIVDDIIDTGLTLKEVKALFLNRGAASVKTCVMLDKTEGRKENINADYFGTTIPNKFVVGYGLDYGPYYRNLPYVGVLKEEVYKK
ncbi:MAG: hypoxanthine phosphoribosyltransferase [Acholeplasmatales bacterium]|nr:hypoxanthine phosphoribosyltransferase [Acholeplasmatales bacterium]